MEILFGNIFADPYRNYNFLSWWIYKHLGIVYKGFNHCKCQFQAFICCTLGEQSEKSNILIYSKLLKFQTVASPKFCLPACRKTRFC